MIGPAAAQQQDDDVPRVIREMLETVEQKKHDCLAR
jgi:hypothetical protein